MPETFSKNCLRCHTTFVCNAGNISLCQCNNVQIDKRVFQYINANYKDCLCQRCLQEIQEILRIYSTQQDNLLSYRNK